MDRAKSSGLQLATLNCSQQSRRKRLQERHGLAVALAARLDQPRGAHLEVLAGPDVASQINLLRAVVARLVRPRRHERRRGPVARPQPKTLLREREEPVRRV